LRRYLSVNFNHKQVPHTVEATNLILVAARENCTDLLFDEADMSLGGPGELTLLSLNNGILVSELIAWNTQAFGNTRGPYGAAVQNGWWNLWFVYEEIRKVGG
jgi:hypothetical protein